MKLFKVKTSKGIEYNVRLCPILPTDSYKILGTKGSWDKKAEIEINNTWYPCKASMAKRGSETLKTVLISRLNKEIQAAMGISLSEDTHIIATSDWHLLYNELYNESVTDFKKIANSVQFSRITFTYHTSHKYISFHWDNEQYRDYIEYSDKINQLKQSLTHVDTKDLEKYQTGSDYGDYSIEYYYSVPVEDVENIINLSIPGLERAKELEEIEEVKTQKRIQKSKNIENGAIYFHCESKPHEEDLSKVVLNRPAPNAGLFTIEHRLPENLFVRIKKYGKYWDKDWLEECDMFFSEPGWRFSIDAIRELAKDKQVYIDNTKFEI